ncbi:phosphate acyltransferase [Clostridia bacterium]|nr:phosphate acyltransferase [Clostridia bacterium]
MNARIAIDAMGGDFSPSETVAGAVLALRATNKRLVLAGFENEIKKVLEGYKLSDEEYSRLEIIHTSEVISTADSPTAAIKQKKDSSIVVGLNLLKNGDASAFISAGSTGALLTGATLIVGRIEGVARPALATLLPNEKGGFTFLLDSGANMDAKPLYLLQFAKMGAIYMENVMNIKKPRVGLVNVGAEPEKGNQLTKEAFELLSKDKTINFIGNVEAREIPAGVCDVLVCDAFVGNILIKYTEGFAKGIFGMIKEEVYRNPISKLGGLLLKQGFGNIEDKFDYHKVGGVPLIGLNGLVVKSHGSATRTTINAAIKQCSSFIDKDIVEKIKGNMSI